MLGGELQLVFAVAAAIILFLFGIEHFSKEIQSVTGERFRRFLARGTSNRFGAFALGAAVTAVIQSSTATSVIAVGLVNAGVVSFRQTLGVIFGANVGTTVTAQLVALKLTDFAPGLILVGFITGLLPFRWRMFGRSIFYFGLVFFSLDLVASAVAPLKTDPHAVAFLGAIRGTLPGVLAGAAFTAIVQSSSVTTGLAIVLLGEGVIDFEQALPLILGANIGTTATALLAAASLETGARRTALSHALYNVIGALVFLPFLGPFAASLEALEFEPAATLATAHLVFNLVTAAIFLAALTPFAALVARILPDEPEIEPIRPLPVREFAEGSLAGSAAVRRWAAAVVRTQQAAYVATVLALETRDKKITNRARRLTSIVDFALEEASALVRVLSSGEPDVERSEAVLKLVITIDHARQLQDSLGDLLRVGDRLERMHARFSIDSLIEVQSVYPVCGKLLGALADLLAATDDQAVRQALAEAEADAEDALQKAYRRFLDLVRKIEERGELADFLSIHQRLRTKVHAFSRYLTHGSAVPPRTAEPRGEPATA